MLLLLDADEPVPDLIPASRVRAVLEAKFDGVTEGKGPDLHDFNTTANLPSTYSKPPPPEGPRKLNSREQITDSTSVCLNVQTPQRRSLTSILLNNRRMEVCYQDRGGSILSTNINFGDNLIQLSAVIMALVLNDAGHDEYNGLEPSLEILASPEGTPVPASEFELQNELVMDGGMVAFGTRIAPMALDAQSCLPGTSGQMLRFYAYGTNLNGRTEAIQEGKVAQRLWDQEQLLKSSSQNARGSKFPAVVKSALQARDDGIKGNTKNGIERIPQLYVPRALFGAGLARFCCLSQTGEAGMLTLGWCQGNRASEASLLRFAREKGIVGILPLAASYDIASINYGGRASLHHSFAPKGAPARDSKLRALVFEGMWMPLHQVRDVRHLLKASIMIVQGTSRVGNT